MNSVSASRFLGLVVFWMSGLCAARADQLVVAWDPSPDSDVNRYHLYYGEAGSSAVNKLSVTGTQGTIPGLTQGKTYFAYATAVRSDGTESAPSESLTYTLSTEPRLAPIGTQTVVAGSLITVQLQVTETSLDTSSLVFSLVSGPSGAAVSNDGFFRWTPGAADAEKTFPVTVQVQSASLGSWNARTSFNILVTAPPVRPNTAPVLVSAGGQLWGAGAGSSVDVLSNGSFESGFADWNISGNVIVKSHVEGEPTHGVSTLKFNTGQTPPDGAASQTFSTTPGQTYTLSFDFGVVAYNGDEQRLGVKVRGATELLSQTFIMAGAGQGAPQWESRTLTFVADSSSATLSLQDLSSATINLDLMVDNVRVIGSRQALPVQFSIMAGNNVTAALMAADADIPANILTYRLVAGPGGATISSEGVFSWTPVQAQATGAHKITVQVTDNGVPPMSDSKDFEVVVLPAPNSAPVLPRPGVQSALIDQEFTLDLSAQDKDGAANVLRYRLLSGPTGATLDEATGLLRWRPSRSQAGTSAIVELEVRDDGNPPLSDSTSVVILVARPNQAPVLGAFQNPMIAPGESVYLTLVATDADVPANRLTFSLLSAPAGAVIDPLNGEFRWATSKSLPPGMYSATVQVTDNGTPPLSDTKTLVVMVAGLNSAPMLAPISHQTAMEGVPLVVPLSASDAESATELLTYSLVSGPRGATVSPNGSFQWTPAEDQGAGTYPVTVQVNDTGSPQLSDRKSFSVAVAEVNSAPALQAIADQRVSPGQMLMVALSASDPDQPGNRLTYRLDAGPSGAAIDPQTGMLTWRLPKSAPTEIYQVIVSVTDDGVPALSDTKAFTLVVAGKGSRSGPGGKQAPAQVLSWVAELDGTRSITFEHSLEAHKLSGQWTHFLEVSEDLIHWELAGPIGSAQLVRDAKARDAAVRFYRIRSQDGGPAPATLPGESVDSEVE